MIILCVLFCLSVVCEPIFLCSDFTEVEKQNARYKLDLGTNCLTSIKFTESNGRQNKNERSNDAQKKESIEIKLEFGHKYWKWLESLLDLFGLYERFVIKPVRDKTNEFLVDYFKKNQNQKVNSVARQVETSCQRESDASKVETSCQPKADAQVETSCQTESAASQVPRLKSLESQTNSGTMPWDQACDDGDYFGSVPTIFWVLDNLSPRTPNQGTPRLEDFERVVMEVLEPFADASCQTNDGVAVVAQICQSDKDAVVLTNQSFRALFEEAISKSRELIKELEQISFLELLNQCVLEFKNVSFKNACFLKREVMAEFREKLPTDVEIIPKTLIALFDLRLQEESVRREIVTEWQEENNNRIQSEKKIMTDLIRYQLEFANSRIVLQNNESKCRTILHELEQNCWQKLTLYLLANEDSNAHYGCFDISDEELTSRYAIYKEELTSRNQLEELSEIDVNHIALQNDQAEFRKSLYESEQNYWNSLMLKHSGFLKSQPETRPTSPDPENPEHKHHSSSCNNSSFTRSTSPHNFLPLDSCDPQVRCIL